MLGRNDGADVALEIAPDRVSAVRLGAGHGVAAHAVEPLPGGALMPSLTAHNIQDRPLVGEAVIRALAALGRPRRIGLLVPDPVAKVSFIRLERVPGRLDELDQLVRWHVRKAVPFPPEEAQVGWGKGAALADGQEFVVTVARRTVIAEYEEVCAAAGAHPGTVDLSTFNLANAMLTGQAPPTGDWLLVNVTHEYVSLALLRAGDLLFFRSRGLDAADAVPDLVHQTAMYYEDRLQGRGLARVILAGPSGAHAADVDDIRRRVETHLPGVVEFVDARSIGILAGPADRLPAAAEVLLPLVGLLRRGRSAA
jgi:Tfp pilus assembly PilM family ATPase